MLYIRVMLLIVLSWAILSCEDDDIPGASYQSGVWFYASAETFPSSFDSVAFEKVFSGSYSFYFHKESDVDTFVLPEIRLMGMPVNYDRSINLVAAEGTTAVEGEQFEIIDRVLPANAISFIPRVLLKNKNLGEEEKVIKFVLAPSDEFPARVVGDTVSDDHTFLVSLRYELKLSNLIQEPPYWSQCAIHFKAWSRVKYDFMVEKLGKYWGVEPISPSDMNEMFNDALKMKEELELWRKAHNGEYMLDENGIRVTF